jgi:hypothetical protein
MYLIYETEEAALERADEEGKYLGFSYWNDGMGTRWLTSPVPTADDKWALVVSDYELDDIEAQSVVDSYLIPATLEDNI